MITECRHIIPSRVTSQEGQGSVWTGKSSCTRNCAVIESRIFWMIKNLFMANTYWSFAHLPCCVAAPGVAREGEGTPCGGVEAWGDQWEPDGNPMGLEVSGISGVEICYIFLIVYWVIALGFPIKRCDMMLYAVLCWKPNLTFLMILTECALFWGYNTASAKL